MLGLETVLEPFRQQLAARLQCHRLVLVRHLGADRAAALTEVLGRLVENALAAGPRCGSVRSQEAPVEAPGGPGPSAISISSDTGPVGRPAYGRARRDMRPHPPISAYGRTRRSDAVPWMPAVVQPPGGVGTGGSPRRPRPVGWARVARPRRCRTVGSVQMLAPATSTGGGAMVLVTVMSSMAASGMETGAGDGRVGGGSNGRGGLGQVGLPRRLLHVGPPLVIAVQLRRRLAAEVIRQRERVMEIRRRSPIVVAGAASPVRLPGHDCPAAGHAGADSQEDGAAPVANVATAPGAGRWSLPSVCARRSRMSRGGTQVVGEQLDLGAPQHDLRGGLLVAEPADELQEATRSDRSSPGTKVIIARPAHRPRSGRSSSPGNVPKPPGSARAADGRPPWPPVAHAQESVNEYIG